MGMGELASFDERGRITIPAEIRSIVGKKDFKISLIDKDTIVLKAVEEPGELVKRIEEIELTGDLERSRVDFQSVKGKFSGKHVENL